MIAQRLRVLICDSDPEVLIDLERVLEDMGFATTTTWNVPDLGRLLGECSFNLLIVGDHPPQMDAEVIFNELRGQHHHLSHVLCLVWRRHLDRRNVERLRSAGATTVVSGPDCASIVEKVKSSLESLSSVC
jgi:DNA-binding response OmpR family regulator